LWHDSPSSTPCEYCLCRW